MVNNETKFVTEVIEQNINSRGTTFLFIFRPYLELLQILFTYLYYTLLILQIILIFRINIMSQTESGH